MTPSKTNSEIARECVPFDDDGYRILQPSFREMRSNVLKFLDSKDTEIEKLNKALALFSSEDIEMAKKIVEIENELKNIRGNAVGNVIAGYLDRIEALDTLSTSKDKVILEKEELLKKSPFRLTKILQNKIQELEKELAVVNKMLLSINQHIVPGVTDSIDGLKKIFEELAVMKEAYLKVNGENGKLHSAIERIEGFRRDDQAGAKNAINKLREELQSLKSYSTGEVEEVAENCLKGILNSANSFNSDELVYFNREPALQQIRYYLSSIHQKYRGELGEAVSVLKWLKDIRQFRHVPDGKHGMNSEDGYSDTCVQCSIEKALTKLTKLIKQ